MAIRIHFCQFLADFHLKGRLQSRNDLLKHFLSPFKSWVFFDLRADRSIIRVKFADSLRTKLTTFSKFWNVLCDYFLQLLQNFRFICRRKTNCIKRQELLKSGINLNEVKCQSNLKTYSCSRISRVEPVTLLTFVVSRHR